MSGSFELVRCPTAGVSMIAPWSSEPPALLPKLTRCVVGSMPPFGFVLSRSTTRTGKPGTGDPLAFQA